MKVQQSNRRVTTQNPLDVVDVTDVVIEAVTKSGIDEGRVELFSRSSSARILVNERESGLLADIKAAVRRAGSDGRYRVGASWVAVPVHAGRVRLGTWQRVMILDLGGPSPHELVVNVVAD